jgi:hypothetical protein
MFVFSNQGSAINPTHLVAGSGPVVLLNLLQVLGEDLLPVDHLLPGVVDLVVLLHKLGEEDVERVLVSGHGRGQPQGQAHQQGSQHLQNTHNK